MRTYIGKIKELKISNFFPFLSTLRHYNFKRLQTDLIAALTVAIIAVPQSMAYAIIAGVHPKYGLYAAILPVIVASLFGSSRFLISGPTNAVSMVIFSAISTTAIGGTLIVNMPDEQKIAMVFFLSFLVGVIQVAMGLGKFGKLINFVSHSVIVGFTAGAGVLIGFNQLKNFLGLNIKSYPHFTETITNVAEHIAEINLPSLGIGVFTILFIIIFRKVSPKIPGLFLAMVFSGIIAFFLKLNLFGVKLIGEISRTLPPISGFHFDADLVKILFMPALAISILAIVEALSIAKSLANSNGEKINGNQELIAQGLGNISASFFSGIPGTGSFTRSAVNFKSGASSRFAGVFSGILVLLTIIIFAPLAKFIPLASLAGILMVIAYQMINKKALLFSFRATKRDRIVLVSTILATIFLELEMAIYIGVFLSIALHIRKASRPQFYEVVPRIEDKKLISLKKGERYCPQLSIFQIEGSLFFASAEAIEEKLYSQANKSIIILRMKQVRFVDASGAHAIDMFIDDCKKKDIKVIFSGLRPNVMGVFKNSRLFEKVGEKNFTNDTETAIKIAFENYINREACKNCNQIIYSECK